ECGCDAALALGDDVCDVGAPAVGDLLQGGPDRALEGRQLTVQGGPLRALRLLDDEGEVVAEEDLFDRLPVQHAHAAGDEVGVGWAVGALVAGDQLGDGLVCAAVIEDADLRKIEAREAQRADLADLTLDPEPERLPRRAGDQVRVEARDRSADELGEVDPDRDDGSDDFGHARPPRVTAPAGACCGASTRAGSTIPICAPGNGESFSSRGGESSQSGTSPIRAVPLRMETLPP